LLSLLSCVYGIYCFVVANGFVGYSTVILSNNTNADYASGESFFTVFGVFFPTATGVFAGINMSGDLRNPSHSIPVGTLSAVGVRYWCFIFYVIHFAIIHSLHILILYGVG